MAACTPPCLCLRPMRDSKQGRVALPLLKHICLVQPDSCTLLGLPTQHCLQQCAPVHLLRNPLH